MSQIFSSITAAVDAEVVDERRKNVTMSECGLRRRGGIAKHASATAEGFPINGFCHAVRCIADTLTICEGRGVDIFRGPMELLIEEFPKAVTPVDEDGLPVRFGG